MLTCPKCGSTTVRELTGGAKGPACECRDCKHVAPKPAFEGSKKP